MGMGSTGVYLVSTGGAIDNMTVIGNGGDGILVEFGTATGNRIIKNGANGINGGNAVITGNMATGNKFYGIVVNEGLVLNNAIIVNGFLGPGAANTGFGANVFSSNNGSFANPQFSGRISIAPNSCDGNVCP
jgi:hypothetical protein